MGEARRAVKGTWASVCATLAAWTIGCGGGGNTAEPNDASTDAFASHEAATIADSSSESSASGDASEGGGAVDAEAITTACAASTTVYCSMLASCSVFAFESLYDSVAACEARVERFCPDALVAPGTGANPADVTACAQAISTQTCAEFQAGRPAACLWLGTETTSAPCEYGYQCQSGFCSIASGFCGTCQAAPSVAVGQPCDESQNPCATGLVCQFATCDDAGACSGVCVAPMGAGSTCTTGAGCSYPLACLQGVCSNPLEQGVVCQGTNACDETKSLSCATNPDGGASICEPVTFVPAGMPCDVTGTAPILCSGGATCRSATGAPANIGTCTAITADGQPCTSSSSCMTPDLCIGGTCQIPVPAASCP